LTTPRLVFAFGAAILATLAAPAARCDVPGAPQPIPVPPIPKPPQLGAQPKIVLPNNGPPGRPTIEIPDAANLDRLAIPPVAAITPADPSDKTPPPQSGVFTTAPATVSPGGNLSQIEEMFFLLDPGSSQFSATAETKLQMVAKELAQNGATRLEVRTFSPAKPHAESAAHRLSLARFFAIRDFLNRNGVGDDKIDGRPLISTPDELNGDRAELYIER
jgi:outer membrane protein OmpA-like peptidoglycan-associated protein